MHARTAKKHERLREIAAEILVDPESFTYTSQVREIMARYDVKERQAKILHEDAQAYLPAVVASRANQIRARAVTRADVALTRGLELADSGRELAAIAQASASLATTLEKIDPANWITTKEAVTEILRALATEELDEEQVQLAAKLSQRLKAADCDTE